MTIAPGRFQRWLVVAALPLLVGVSAGLTALWSPAPAALAFGLLIGLVAAVTLLAGHRAGLIAAVPALLAYVAIHVGLVLSEDAEAIGKALTWVPAVPGLILLLAAVWVAGRRPAPELAGQAFVRFPRPGSPGPLNESDGLARAAGEFARARAAGVELPIATLGLEAAPGGRADRLPDLMGGLMELAWGAVRREDIVFPRGRTELILLFPSATGDAARIVLGRIQEKSAGMPVSVLGAMVVTGAGSADLDQVFEELAAGLELCRSAGMRFADPRLLSHPVPTH